MKDYKTVKLRTYCTFKYKNKVRGGWGRVNVRHRVGCRLPNTEAILFRLKVHFY